MVRAPRGDSRWNSAVNAALAALDNRLIDVIAARGTKRARDVPGSIESIERIALSEREIVGIAGSETISEGNQLAASAFIDGVNAVRIVVVARADRTRGELDASLGLMARAVLGEISLASTRASLEFWRTHGAESGRRRIIWTRQLQRRGARLWPSVSRASARSSQAGVASINGWSQLRMVIS